MKTLLAGCFLMLVSCKSPTDCQTPTDYCTDYLGWVGRPMGGSHPPKPKEDEPDTFHAGADCAGPAYILGYGEEFPYASVRIAGLCIAEDGVAYGFQVGA